MENSPAPPPPPGDHPTGEIPTTFNDLIKELGYPEAKFVMQAESLLDQERQNLLLLPMQETNQTISLINEEQKQNQLITGTRFQIWSLKNNDSLPGYALIKVDKGANQQGPEIRPIKEIPPEFENRITNLGYSKPVLLIQRELTESDLGIGSHGTYFFIPLEKFNGLGFLTEEQKRNLGIYGSKLNATLIFPSLGQSTTTLMRWKWDKWPHEEFLYTYALSGWKSIVDQFNLSIGTRIQVWTFNKAPDNIGFAVVVVDAEKVEELKRARVVPHFFENQIRGFGGSAVAFVMEMTLLSNVKFYLSLPIERVENQFLTDEEKLQVKKNGKIDAVLIGRSINQKDVKDFKIKFKFWGAYYFEFRGAGWKNFVKEYGVEQGQRVRIWSFRRPSAIAGSHLGRAGPLQIRFALVVVDPDM